MNADTFNARPQPLDDTRLAEIAERWARIPTDEQPRITVTNSSCGGQLLNALGHARHDAPALLAEVQRLKAELAGAREAALTEAAGWFDRAADAEPDQSYRARVMRGAANDVRRLISPTTDPTEGAVS